MVDGSVTSISVTVQSDSHRGMVDGSVTSISVTVQSDSHRDWR